ncbi:MAG: methionine--tRNA ligase [Desulfobulbaceae bacterium]|nr:methionine--tRNA ligase [Desulfobulbaceae bacterium]
MTAYITTPIYYVNAEPHIGHAYTTIVADTYSRFRRLCGDRARFQTGTDEHGEKIAEAAAREGISAAAYADKISAMFRTTWPILACEPDNFIRTTDAKHIETVQRALQAVYDRGDIYFDSYTGLYCRGCERFLTEKELVDGLCPDHRSAPREIAEQNYFFRMSKYQDRLIEHIKNNPDLITPERYRNEVLSFLSEPLEDLCISRPKSRLTWGIELPFDANFVTYVWFDALINYLSGLGYPDDAKFAEFWPVAEHLIAKDILKPHAIYWPTMLMSLGLPLYKKLHVHGYWNNEDAKMSKSLGNVVRPGDLARAYGLDPFRYFALREMSFGLDASFSREAIIARCNSDLSNDLGNLFSRSLSMVKKYAELTVPVPTEVVPVPAIDAELRRTALDMLAAYRQGMADFRFHRALQAVWELVGQANKYIVVVEPWALAKDPKQRPRLDTVLYNLCEALRLLTLVLRPVMPQSAVKMADALGYAPDDAAISSLAVGGAWGVLAAGQKLRDCPALFPRLELVKDEPISGEEIAGKVAIPPATDGLDIAQFRDFDIRVVTITAAERVKKSDKLLRLIVRAPEERVIVSGIGQRYAPEDLVGCQVVAVCNLKPAKLMGITSQGMILTAKDSVNGRERLALVTVTTPTADGASIS